MMNIALGIKVASALFLVFTLLTAFQIVEQKLEDLSGTQAQQQENNS